MILSGASSPKSPRRRGAGFKHMVAALALVAFASGTASAQIVYLYSGPAVTGDTPQGSGPYATATLSDLTRDVGGTVYDGDLFTIDNHLIGA